MFNFNCSDDNFKDQNIRYTKTNKKCVLFLAFRTFNRFNIGQDWS